MSNTLKLGIRAVAFLLIFLILLTLITLIYLPKRDAEKDETAQPVGFYKEPPHTLDVLYLGSCNMYSSVSPVLIYQEYGITGYAFCCPDQEMSTSYTYLKEALKTQDLKAVVVESLFLTAKNNQKREHYNRFALDYFPLNLNKIALSAETSKRESEMMREIDSSSPDTLLTFAGYIFPLLRYHNRRDLTSEDVTFFLENDLSNFYKGGYPQYSYTGNDDNFFNMVFNGDEINEMSQKYVPMIKDLCDKAGIPLIIVKSPNYSRWGYDDTHTKIVRDFAGEIGAQFVDFLTPEYNNFEIWDYGHQTGRLNVYGVQKFSHTMGKYLSEVNGLQPTILSEQDKASWDSCVEQYYRVAAEEGFSLYPGEIAQLANLDGAMRVRWNPIKGCNTYSIYRAVGKTEAFSLLTSSAEGCIFQDPDVDSGQGYTYYVVPNEGDHAGQPSPTSYYVYLDMPRSFNAINRDGAMQLSWEPVPEASKYWLQRRSASDFNFHFYTDLDGCYFLNSQADNGALYYYRLRAVYQEGDAQYSSMSTIVRGMPQRDPVISGVSSRNGNATINWNKVKNQDEIQIFRRCEDEEQFTLIDTVEADTTQFIDYDVNIGFQYFYKIVSIKQSFDYYGISDDSNIVGVKVHE